MLSAAALVLCPAHLPPEPVSSATVVFGPGLLKEHLLVSKALPVFRPHTTSAPLATYHFCMRSIVPALRLTFEAFSVSLLAFVPQVPVSIRLFLEIYRWPRGLSSLVRASTRRYYFTVLNVDRYTASNAMLL